MLPSNHHKWGMDLCFGISEVTDPVLFPAQTVWPYLSILASQTELLCKSMFLFHSQFVFAFLCVACLSWDPGTCSVDQAGVEGLPHHCWREPLLKAEFSHADWRFLTSSSPLPAVLSCSQWPCRKGPHPLLRKSLLLVQMLSPCTQQPFLLLAAAPE